MARKKKQQPKQEEAPKSGWREAWGILLLAASVLLLLGVISYDPGDVPVLQLPSNQPPANYVGPVGAWAAFVAFMAVGVAGYVLPVFLGVLSVFMMFRRRSRLWPKAMWMGILFAALVCLSELQFELWQPLVSRLNLGGPGGALGLVLGQYMIIGLLGHVGAGILLALVIIAALVYLVEVRPAVVVNWAGATARALADRVEAWRDKRRDLKDQLEHEAKEVADRRKRLEETLSQKKAASKPTRKTPAKAKTKPEPTPEPEPEADELEVPVPAPRPRARKQAPAPVIPESSGDTVEYRNPPVSILDDLSPVAKKGAKEDLVATGQVLEETLAEFGIEAQVTNVQQGPVVTRYEMLPAPGIRVERIAGLSNNIALAMKAESIRVQAPIPGKGVVGIEVPNAKANVVFMREIVESTNWTGSKAALPLALGKDVGGKEIVADLAAMPHMLIAGATGAGKTVCMNSILAGLLLSRTPEDMRLMLIDPKIVEFSGYNDLPHLVVPVITEAKKVGLGLRWAINEMEKRYKMFAKVKVRDIKGFNNRPEDSQGDLFGESEEDEVGPIPAHLPYIVIIVDELADLMMVAQAEIENAIARLAQLSRAVGIHMIIATQRPSVNVITGTIKANFPARIAFQVAQKVDSRTILDTVGADKLLGKGDLLFMPPGSSKLIRAQGTLTTDNEIVRIVDYIKQQGRPEFITEVHDKIEGKTVDLPEMDSDDELLEPAVEVIRQTRRASTSSLQRRLRIGYTRAARLMDVLEEKGIIGPPRGSDPREILIDLDGEIPQNDAELPEE